MGGTQYRVECSVQCGVLSTLGDIMSTVGDVQYHGGYHDKCGEIS